MSDNRKILVAKRNNERSRSTNNGGNGNKSRQEDYTRKGVKRQVPLCDSSTKNLANDRLKRLRTSLNEEVSNQSHQSPHKTPIGNKSCKAHVANPSYKTLVANQSYKTPVANTSYKAPVASQTYKAPVANTSHKAPVAKQTYKAPVASQSHEVPVASQSSSGPHQASVANTRNNKSRRKPRKRRQDVAAQVTETKIAKSGEKVFAAPSTNIVQVSNDNENEDMEWSACDETYQIGTKSENVHWGLPIEGTSSALYNDSFFVVVDTNIFLSQMQLIKSIVEMHVTGGKQPVVYVPWIVLEELDFIKDDSLKGSLKWKAQEAVKYIYKNLSAKNGKMMGQSLNDVNEQKYAGKSQDNKIISCCLQILERFEPMVLLTGDINLKNKAHINNIPVCSHSEIMAKISQVLYKTKSKIIFEKVTELCRTVIHECAKNAYGPVCERMSICQTAPQSLEECIAVFTKYWFPVFQEVLMKQVKTAIDDLSSFLAKHKNIKDDSNELSDLLKLCIRFCLFLKDVECCRVTVESTIRELNSVKAL